MTRPRILNLEESYTFSRYFELPYTTADILADLGFGFSRSTLHLPRYAGDLGGLTGLHQCLDRNLNRVNPTSEAARREVLISPILLEVCEISDARLAIEYPISVNNYLKGSLDYFATHIENLLVVEAKQADLSRGFTQLAVELIALDQWTDSSQEILYGAVTTGESWRFGALLRAQKVIRQDIRLYQVPEGLEALVRVLAGILDVSELQ
jgi:hypothetical protein